MIMKTIKIDILNVVIMGVCAVVAYAVPFELFLFSYAVLGPLHYLTEISWLHRKQYFVAGISRGAWPVFSLAGFALLTLIVLGGKTDRYLPLYAAVLLFIFLSAYVISSLSSFRHRLVGFFIASALAGAAAFFPSLVAVVAILLPTVLHVFLFTFFFMLSGALKSGSRWGVAAAVLFIVLSFILLFDFRFAGSISITAYARTAYHSFEKVNITMLSFLPIKIGDARAAVYSSVFGIAVMRFLAFVYTYHYLNWFSKLQVIRWHLVPRRELVFTVFLWLLSVALYAYDYRIGLVALYFLSMLHVLLEFPLNHSSFKTVFAAGYRRLAGFSPK